MGSGASVEEIHEEPQERPPTSGGYGRGATRQPSARPHGGYMTPSGSRAPSRPTSRGSSVLRSSLRSASLAPSHLRKMRAAALGRKSACTVTITRGGFTLQHIQICQGQLVTFEWNEPDGRGFNVMQVMNDGVQYRPVVGGYNSGPVRKRGVFQQQFNLEGEFKFVSAGLKVTPLTIGVYPRKAVEAELTDDGFIPPLIRIDEGNAVNWIWASCGIPRTISEAKFSHKMGTLVQKESEERIIPTKTGSYLKEFGKPGMYYFQSEGLTSGELFTCIVHVRESQREYEIEILDREFDPPIIVIQEGDRVWWYWDKDKCKRHHCVYQIQAPPRDHDTDEPYMPYKNGFKWPTPSKSGLLSHEFYEPGIFFYSDRNFNQAAEYIGTIIVKPKQPEHFIMLSPDGFSTDLLYAETGDRIWWTWGKEDVDSNFTIIDVEKCISPVGGRPGIENEASGEGSYMDEELEVLKVAAGLETVQLGSIGVYHYRLSDSARNVSTCSIISKPGPRNHTVHVTDTSFQPKVVTVHPGDRIWWVWQGGKKPHNITQVTHQGTHIKAGFCSGCPRDCPSAFMQSFDYPGVYYYVSDGVVGHCGAIVVTSQPKVLEIQVADGAFNPNPALLSVNDVVAWTFHGLRHNDVCNVDDITQVLDAQNNSKAVSPRRCLNRLFTDTGIFHFASKSFVKHGKKVDGRDERRLSSVLVDDVHDSMMVRVTNKGFFPITATVRRGESILFTWKNSEEAHNIIHVNPPDTDNPLAVVQGGLSFNSGRPVPNNSFLYTFDEEGIFGVASQGAPGYAATFTVVDDAVKVGTPYVVSKKKGGSIEKGSVVQLASETAEAQIYYTIDGALPELHKTGIKRNIEYLKDFVPPKVAKLYDPDKGVVLKRSGFCFIRTIAVADGMLRSDIFTSRRFTVLPGDDEESSASEPEPVDDSAQMETARLWWTCVPTIKACFTDPGVMELFWEPPSSEARPIIRGYQIFLNGVTYCEMFPRLHNSVNVAGMAGGHVYEVILEVYPVDAMFLPHRSNKLVMKCPKTNSTGGPVISLETTDKTDDMAIVWMSITSPDSPIAGYRIYLNGTMCGNQVVPDDGNDRCKVVIDGCQMNFLYRVQVSAMPEDGRSPKLSNELEVSLPFETAYIKLPPSELRLNDGDLYREYMEVREGSGYVPSMDQGPVTSLAVQQPKYPIARMDVVDQSAELLEDESYMKEEALFEDGHAGSSTPIVEQAKVKEDSMLEEEHAGSSAPSTEQGPWQNKMKHAASSHMATSRMTQLMMSNQNKPSNDPQQPFAGVEVEVQDDDPKEGEQSRPPAGKVDVKKKHVSKMAVVEVHEEAHLNLASHSATVQSEMQSVMQLEMHALSAVPVIGHQDGQESMLPVPMVTAEDSGMNAAVIRWHFQQSAEPLYRLIVNAVNVIGTKFKKEVASDLSFECLQDEDGEAVSAIQHVWNITTGNQCSVQGLIPGNTYTIYVVATYALKNAQQPYEIQAKSSPVKITTLGPPAPPTMKTVSLDLYQVCLGWELGEVHKNVNVTGFRILVNGEQLGHLLDKSTRRTTIDKLKPGRTMKVSVVVATDNAVGDSEPSNVINVTCPSSPPAPHISHQPSFKKGTIIVAWERPAGMEHAPYGEDVIYYRVYLDDVMHGEVKASSACNRNGYQYCLTSISPGQSRDIYVKAFAGQRKVDPTADHVFCLSESEKSMTVPMMCPAPPQSPHLRIDGMHSDGVDITWEMPQQYGDAVVSGYQMLKNSKLYGSIIPADVHSLRIKDVTLGEKVELQILALTDHPVGRQDAKDSPNEGDSGIEASTVGTINSGFTEIYVGDRYSACKPGPKLAICYTGLVQPPSKVWCEQVTGHSALIVWNKAQRPQPHYVEAERYQVTWWPGEKAEDDVNSQSTKDDHLLITGLKANVTYHVVVEARKMQKYRSMAEDGDTVMDDGFSNTFILTAQSDHLTLKTAKPPSPPTNLGVVATTCSTIQVAWDAPQENGVEVIGIRVDAVSLKSKKKRKHACIEVLPDNTTAIVDNLDEKTEYLVTVTTITEEYFDQLPHGHELKTKRVLPTSAPPKEDMWLPSSSVLATTSGTNPPTDLKIIRTNVDTVKVSWKPPIVYGSNRLQGTIVRWAKGKFSRNITRDDSPMAHHRSIVADCSEATIDGLIPGILYKIVVEAVVSVKTTLESSGNNPEYEKQNRRTVHVMSKPVFVRTRAPCDPPRPIITGYDSESIQLYWEKPLLRRVIGKDENDNPRCLKLSLEGYRLEVNGKPHVRLGSSSQSCNLVKCKPGKVYSIMLIALTCTEEVKKERRRRLKDSANLGSSMSSSISSNKDWQTMTEDFDNDEAASEPISVTIPKEQDGFIKMLRCSYLIPDTGIKDGAQDLGDIRVDWTLQGDNSIIKQFNVTWQCMADGATQTQCIDMEERSTVIAVASLRSVFDVNVVPLYSTDVIAPTPQKVQVMVPGRPDPPVIFCRSISSDEFVIEWVEPSLHRVKIKGYQVYLNAKKVGNELGNHHRKVVIPCKPRRHYKVQLVALSADPLVDDSEMSPTLYIDTDQTEKSHYVMAQPIDSMNTIVEKNEDGELEDKDEEYYSELKVRVVSVSDNSIHLDWLMYSELPTMSHYKVTWSSVGKPAEMEVLLRAGEKSCVIHKCFPGTNHYIRIHAIANDSSILDRSKQLVVQTSAPPDTPVATLRACNFKYIAIEWEKPATYGLAHITGYKVYVNGVVEALLKADQLCFTFTHGKWCREYVFQIQGLTTSEKLNSKPSEPLEVTWPGVQAPALVKAPAHSGNAVRVTWEIPQCTGGVKIKQYKVVCLDETTERPVQIISPIHPETTEAEIHNLKKGAYIVYLEVHLHGCTDVVKSDALHIQPSVMPDPPQITVTVIGLEERRQIEKVTCDLINSRDRLLSRLYGREVGSSPKHMEANEQMRNKDLEELSQVEERLDDCLSSLIHYTGHVLAHISWTCVQSNPDLRVTGYKVLVDGKQYGTTLHAGVKNVRIKLGLIQKSYRLTMVSVIDHPHTLSVPSSGVELLTEPFRPFSFFCFLAQQPKKNQPSEVSFNETLALERKLTTRRMVMNVGLMKRHVAPPRCTLMDIFEGEYHPLFPPSGPSCPTAILFWAKWHPVSHRVLEWFVKFSRNYSSKYDFVAVACESAEMTAVDQQQIIHAITENGWREDTCIRHVTSRSSPPGTLHDDIDKYGDGNLTSNDACELFRVTGVPTIVIVHPEDYVAWKGRYCAFDYHSFEHFLQYIFLTSLGQNQPGPEPWSPNLDLELTDVQSSKKTTDTQMMPHRPMRGSSQRTTGSGSNLATTIHINSVMMRPKSAKKLFIKTNKNKVNQISVNFRPYSATVDANTAEKQQQRAETPPRRIKSGRTMHRTT